jgi:phage protein D
MTPDNPHAAIELTVYKHDEHGKYARDKHGDKIILRQQVWDSWRHPRLFKQVTVQLTTGMASEAAFRVFDSTGKFVDSLLGIKEVLPFEMRCWMGFGQGLGEPVFKGMLARIEKSETDITLRAYDMGYKMRQMEHAGYHKGDDLKILKKLAERSELKFEGPDREFRIGHHRSYMQAGQTDWDLASERAREIGLVLYVRGDTLFAKEPAIVKRKPLIVLTYRKDALLLRPFDLSYKLPENKRGRPSVVEVRGRGHGGKSLVGKSRKHKRGTGNVFLQKDIANHTQSYADRVAHAKKQLQREHSFSCTVRTIPQLPSVRADVGDTVELREFGSLFSGLYLCDKVTHDLVAAGFTTEYDLYADIEGEE